MATSVLTSKGQTTIPMSIRHFLKVSAGDRLEFIAKKDGEVVVKPAVTEVKELRGLLAAFARKRPVSIEEMNQAIRKRAGRQK